MALNMRHEFVNQSGITFFLAKTSLIVPYPNHLVHLLTACNASPKSGSVLSGIPHIPGPLPRFNLLVNVTSTHPILEARTSAFILHNSPTASLSFLIIFPLQITCPCTTISTAIVLIHHDLLPGQL